ncbi:MAG: hypothetical protein Q9162_007911 [Coniocarpon cinnabarinum]
MDHVSILSISGWVGFVVTSLWAILWLLALCIEPAHDPKEPPLISSRLPLLGHAWGLYKHGPRYFLATSAISKSPIYTLNFFNGKTYVITAPNIVNMVSRNSKSISFNPFIAEIGIRLTQASDDARRIIERNIDGGEAKDSYVLEIHDHMITTLTPGPEMNYISDNTLKESWERFLKPLEAASSPTKLSFHSFLQHMLAVSSTTALYGSTNPLLVDPTVESSFWEYCAHLNMVILNIYPQWTASRAHKARSHVAHAFKRYFEADPVGDCSALTEGRYRIARKHGMDMLDAGRLELGTLLGILVNTVPAFFYMLCHIFSSPSLLGDIRAEIEGDAISENEDGTVVLNMTKLRSNCTLLHSTLQETLRMYSEGATVRLVIEDTLIDNRFLLRKGAVLQMPNSVIHRDKQAWGDTTYNARRFLKDRKSEGKGNSAATTSAGSYRPFGGGSTLCPGRHYATMELMGMVAFLIWRFDILPVDKRGWILPEPKQDSVVEFMFPPSRDVEVMVGRREKGKGLGKEWKVVFE